MGKRKLERGRADRDQPAHVQCRFDQPERRRCWVVVTLLIVLLALNLSANPLLGSWTSPIAQAQASEPQIRENSNPRPAPTPTVSIFTRLFGTQPNATLAHEDWRPRLFRALISFLVAALLAAILAFRPRKNLPVFQRNPFVAQTQILLAVVGAALMIVVADNAARAFGIFAAASLIRFRTNIRDPKEITVLLVSLAIGLASGIGRWEIAAGLTLFVILVLWPLERFELRQVFRAMELKIKTQNLSETDAALKKIFRKRRISAELRKLDPEDENDPHGVILYYLNLNPEISLDRLSQEIFSSDAGHIESVQWQQKKSGSYLYR